MADDPEGLVETVVRLPELSGQEWDRFTDQIAAEAGHLAALLNGEVPRSLVQAADAAGVALLPGIGDLESDCDCPDIGDPCPHSAALCYQTAWLLDADPFVLLLLRGRDGRELLDSLGDRAAASAPALDRPVPAAEAYSATRPELPDLPVRTAATAAAPAVPPPPGFDPGTLPRLAADAAHRARALLTAHP